MVISGFPREAYGESRIWAIFVPIIPGLDTHPSNRKRHYLDQRYADLFALLLKALTMTLYYAVLLIFSGSNFSPFFQTARVIADSLRATLNRIISGLIPFARDRS